MEGMNVLVASDDAVIVRLLAEMSEQRGHNLTVARSDDEIFACINNTMPDLIVLDLDGRSSEGLQLLKQLSLQHCGSKVVLIGSCNQRTLGSARQVGAKRGLVMAPPLAKPLDKARIVCSVLDILTPGHHEIRPRDIETALAENQLRVFYQPLVNLRTEAVYGAEALLRWEHPEFGWLQPSHIIPLAEEHGLIVPVTRWVIQAALEQYSRWASEGWDFNIAINISAQVLRNPDFADETCAAAEKAGVSPRNVILEVTESQTLAEAEELDVLDTLTSLSLHKFGLAIDDFGTGYSSLGRLNSAPFTEIKIDKSFVMDAADPDAPMHQEADVIVHAIADLGHNLNMTVIAEGVCSREAWELVDQHRCDVAQGYFIARPLDSQAFSRWLYRWGVPSAPSNIPNGSLSNSFQDPGQPAGDSAEGNPSWQAPAVSTETTTESDEAISFDLASENSTADNGHVAPDDSTDAGYHHDDPEAPTSLLGESLLPEDTDEPHGVL
jgi:EAL domain-containing protein (putative c-di-GMP-specific phosphodiesterase class I)